MKKVGAIVVLLSLTACVGGAALILPQVGDYTGFYGQESVSATLKQVSETELSLSFSSQTWTFTVDPSSGSLEVQNPEGMEKFTLSGENSDQDCGKTTLSDRRLELCWSSQEIHWSEMGPDGSMLASLDLARLQNGEMPAMEKPQSYSLGDLVSRAKSRNFQTVVAFKKMLVAKDEAVTADADLLPHGGASDVLNLLSSSLYTQLKSIGDLAPFLLPNRWFRAAAANDMAAADRDAWEIMDLDGVNYVESFAYASARDAQALQSMSAQRTQVAALRDFVKGEEPAGLVPLGTSDVLSALVNQIDLGADDLGTLQTNELSALAEASGFYNPAAITDVTFTQDQSGPWAGNPLTLDFDTASRLAIGTSPELRQMADLIAWAKNEAKAEVFDWMDPSGNSDGGIGLGLPSYTEAGRDNVNLMESQTDLAKSILLNNLQKTVNDLQKSASDFQLDEQEVQAEQRIVLEQTQNLKLSGIGFDMSILVDALQGLMNSETRQIDDEYAYQLALSRYYRLLSLGVYANPGL